MVKFAIEKFYKGKSMGLVPDTLCMRSLVYDDKNKAEEMCNEYNDKVKQYTNCVVYKLKEIEV